MALINNPLDSIASVADAAKGIIGMFKADPTVKLQLASAEDEAALQAKLQLQLAQIVADSQNLSGARAMQTSVKSILPPLLALVVTVGFFGLLYMLIFRNIPAGSHDIIIAMVGVLGAAWGAVVNYYFGSSSGSADKTEVLSQALNGK